MDSFLGNLAIMGIFAIVTMCFRSVQKILCKSKDTREKVNPYASSQSQIFYNIFCTRHKKVCILMNLH